MRFARRLVVAPRLPPGGTVPLPLDLSDPQGGSKVLGGPLDQDRSLACRCCSRCGACEPDRS
eukprot:12633978-Alexandrium_andersonii.AAC.1